MVIFRERRGLGLVAMRDEPRADPVDATRQLQALGLEAIMRTATNSRTAAAIAEGFSPEVRAELMPEDKVSAVRNMAASGGVMIGDGINDALALAEP